MAKDSIKQIINKEMDFSLNLLNNNKINCINPLRKNELLDYSPKMKNSLRLTKKYISLPIFPDLPLKTVDLISEKIKEFLK